MKRTPTLSFKLDETAAQAERVEEILRGQGEEP
jgi:ribosome-binding factor A